MEKANYPITVLCRVMRVSRSGYYRWRAGRASQRQKQCVELLQRIRQSYLESGCRYGSPRITRDLQAEGIVIGRNRVARLMRQAGIQARIRRRWRSLAHHGGGRQAAHLLARDFSASAPNQKWASDITYIRTAEGWLYLCVFVDLFSRRVVGWAFSPRIDQQLVLDALEMARLRRPLAAGLMIHSDQGLQYRTTAYQRALLELGAKCSMSRKGNCWDNAVVESFFASLKKELVYQTRFATRSQARIEIFDYIEHFYNRNRRHSTLGYLSPYDYEQQALHAYSY